MAPLIIKQPFRLCLADKISQVRDRRGFTLVEILVVIAIIALLVGVSFAGYSAALMHARKAKCAGNLRAIGVGMLAFAGDNNQMLPESGGTIPHGVSDSPPPAGSGLPSWTEQLEPYLGASTDTVANRVYQCPDSSQNPVNAQYSYFNGAHAAIAANGQFSPVSLLAIHSLSSFIMAGDNSFNLFQAIDADKDDYTQDPAFNGGTLAAPTVIPIHGGYSNILFADGHVESLKYFDATAVTTVYQGPGAAYNYLWTP